MPAKMPGRSSRTVLEPYRVTLAYTFGTLRSHQGDCPRSVVVHARDVEDACQQARLMVPHVHGITRVVFSSSNSEARL